MRVETVQLHFFILLNEELRYIPIVSRGKFHLSEIGFHVFRQLAGSRGRSENITSIGLMLHHLIELVYILKITVLPQLTGHPKPNQNCCPKSQRQPKQIDKEGKLILRKTS